MNSNRMLVPRTCRLVIGAGALLTAVCAAVAAPPASSTDRSAPAATPEQTYQRDRTACLSGATPQDRQSCLKEAGAALAAARRGRLDNGNDAQTRQANATERCRVHKDSDDRLACERMALGEGRTEGSVAEGAVVREMVTRSVKP
ncbi:MAG: hypothetical protein ABIX12_06355 [Rubrivivax sp.]